MLGRLIADILREQGFTWSVDGEPYEPTDSDVEKILDTARRHLYPIKEGVPQYELGGILVQKTNDTYDVYVRIGELP